jgi:hypothetical protein
MKQTIIFPHVPKAGGTSIKVQLEQSGLKVLMDYRAGPGNTQWHRRKHRIWERRLREMSLSDYDVVFGHFPVMRYRGPQYRYVALVRDPVERTVSQYFYHISRSTMTHLKPQRLAFYQAVASGRIGFLDYCRRTNCANIYKQYLGRWPSERFLLVGDTHDYGDFVDRFNRLFGTKLTEDVHLRKREEQASTVSEADMAKLRELLKDEIDWYGGFVARH